MADSRTSIANLALKKGYVPPHLREKQDPVATRSLADLDSNDIAQKILSFAKSQEDILSEETNPSPNLNSPESSKVFLIFRHRTDLVRRKRI
jgi:hypothetical protein